MFLSFVGVIGAELYINGPKRPLPAPGPLTKAGPSQYTRQISVKSIGARGRDKLF